MRALPAPLNALTTGVSYLTRNPLELVRQAKAAARFQLAIPLDLARWGISQLRSKSAPKDVEIGARTPALTLGATLALMGNELRVSAAITIDELHASADELRLALRISDLTLVPLGAAENGPLGALLKSGAIDLRKPGNLVNFMPSRPAALVEAKDDRIVLDLMKVPKIAGNARLRKVLGVLAPVVSVKDVVAEDDHLVIGLRPHPTGVVGAFAALRA